MGLDGEIREHYRKNELTAVAFKPMNNGAGWRRTNYVDIDDVLTRIYRQRGPRFDYTFSGQEFFDMVMHDARAVLNSKEGKAAIICCDINRHVPQRKHATQQKRDAAAAKRKNEKKSNKPATPPPSKLLTGGTVSDQGIHLPDGRIVRISIPQFRVSRSYRHALMEYCAWKARAERFPPGKTLIFDFDEQSRGAIAYQDNKAVALTWAKHHLGETDMMIPFWQYVYRHYNVRIHTIDQDTWAIMVHRIATSWVGDWGRRTENTTNRIDWLYGNDDWCDLVEFTMRVVADMTSEIPDPFTDIHLQLRLGARLFVLVCLLCGTDYVDKNEVANQCGVDVVLRCVRMKAFFLTRGGKHLDLDRAYHILAEAKEEVWPEDMLVECDRLSAGVMDTSDGDDAKEEKGDDFMGRLIEFMAFLQTQGRASSKHVEGSVRRSGAMSALWNMLYWCGYDYTTAVLCKESQCPESFHVDRE